MNYVSSLFSYVVTFVFIFQTTAWASKIEHRQDSLHEAMRFYNSLSSPDLKRELEKMMKSRSAEDQQEIKWALSQLAKKDLPKLELYQDQISFRFQGKIYFMKYLGERKFEFQGTEINLGPGKIQEARQKLEELLRAKKVTLMDYIIPSAHAFVPGLGILAAVGIIVVIGAIVSYFIDQSTAEGIKETCTELRKKLDDSDMRTNESLMKIRHTLSRAMDDIRRNRNCNNKNSDSYQACLGLMNCIQSLEAEVSELSAVNGSGRDRQKEAIVPKSVPKASVKKAQKQ